MPSNLPVLNLRMDPQIKFKITFIAKENGRSANKEIEQLIKQHIKDYEAEHGEIQIPEHPQGGGRTQQTTDPEAGEGSI